MCRTILGGGSAVCVSRVDSRVPFVSLFFLFLDDYYLRERCVNCFFFFFSFNRYNFLFLFSSSFSFNHYDDVLGTIKILLIVRPSLYNRNVPLPTFFRLISVQVSFVSVLFFFFSFFLVFLCFL